jgi:hypothetical protein
MIFCKKYFGVLESGRIQEGGAGREMGTRGDMCNGLHQNQEFGQPRPSIKEFDGRLDGGCGMASRGIIPVY